MVLRQCPSPDICGDSWASGVLTSLANDLSHSWLLLENSDFELPITILMNPISAAFGQNWFLLLMMNSAHWN